jgi:hypothetical protein
MTGSGIAVGLGDSDGEAEGDGEGDGVDDAVEAGREPTDSILVSCAACHCENPM